MRGKQTKVKSKKHRARTVATDRLVDGAAYLREQLKDPEFRYHYEQRLIILEIARTVKELRENAGLTQQQLADLIGSTQPVVARLEHPANQRVARFATLHKIASALGRQLTLRLGLDLAEPEEKRGPLLAIEDRVER